MAADWVGAYTPNKTNINRLTKGRSFGFVPSDIDFGANRKLFSEYLQTKDSYYRQHDNFILSLYQVLGKYENNGFSSQELLMAMGYTNSKISPDQYNLTTLMRTIGRMDINSDQMASYLNQIYNNQSLTPEDRELLTKQFAAYSKAYSEYRPKSLALYEMDQEGASSIRGAMNPGKEQNFLYAITTAMRNSQNKNGATSDIYLLTKEQMKQFTSEDMYFSIHNTVDKLGLLTYTRFGANAAFSPSVLDTVFPEQKKIEQNQNILKEYFNDQTGHGMVAMIHAMNERYGYIESIGDTHYGRASEAGLRGYFADGQIMPIQKGENQLGLREGDIVMSFGGREVHVSIKNITNFTSQRYDEYKERAPEDMAYLLSDQRIFMQYFKAIPNDNDPKGQQDWLNENVDECQQALDENPEVAQEFYDRAEVRDAVQEVLDSLGY